MKLIINADDFGYNNHVNKAIEQAIIEHKISSTSIMANAPCFNEAILIAKKYDYISYGVHLNIIEYSPLTNKNIFTKYKLLDDSGNFIEGAIFCINEYTDELKRAIKEEWLAQINKVKEAGIKISHIDSHQHTHSIYLLQDVLIDVLKECKIFKCRRKPYFSISKLLRTRNYSNPVYDKKGIKKIKKNSVWKKLYLHLIKLPISQYKWLIKIKKYAIITDEIVNYQMLVQDVKKYPQLYRKKIVEAECHPGLIYNKLETELLMADMLSKYMPSYQLISYNDLNKA